MCAHNRLPLIKHLHVTVTLPTRLLHKNGLSDNNSSTFILHHCVQLFPYMCAPNRLPLLKHESCGDSPTILSHKNGLAICVTRQLL